MVQYTDSVSETLATADVSASAVRFTRTAPDVIRISRTVDRIYRAPRSVSRTFRITDIPTDSWARAVAVAEATTVGDALAARGLGLLVAERLGIAPTEAIWQSLKPQLVDTLRLRDRLTATQPLTLADQVQLGDVLVGLRALTVVERLGLADSLFAKSLLGFTVAERVSLSDALRRFFGGEALDQIGFTTTALAPKRLNPVLTDPVAVGDSLTPKLVLRITAPDNIVLDDAETVRMVFRPVLSDQVEITAAYIQPGETITTWVLNTRTKAVTEYENYAFNSFAQIGAGRYIGADHEGIYELQGEDDDGVAIMARIKSGLMQFAGSRFVGLKGVYLGMRAQGDFYVKIETGDGRSYTYQTRVENMETTKVHVGKGLRTRYLSFELVNKDGQDFDLDTVEFVPMYANRRV